MKKEGLMKWEIIFLKEMFRRVGAKFSLKAVRDDDAWYLRHSWTIAEQEDFKKWMSGWLDANWKEHRETLNWRKSWPVFLKESRLNYWLFNHGWSYKEREQV